MNDRFRRIGFDTITWRARHVGAFVCQNTWAAPSGQP